MNLDVINDNSTNHVYIHDFMYVYMFLQNGTSRLGRFRNGRELTFVDSLALSG